MRLMVSRNFHIHSLGLVFKSGENTTAYLAGTQAICLGVTMGFAVFGGLVTGSLEGKMVSHRICYLISNQPV